MSTVRKASNEFQDSLLLDDPDADVILRSCDHHEFRVLELYIIKVSPVLRELIQSASSSHVANPTTTGTQAKSLPSVQLPDSGATLSSLFTFILPVPPVLPSTIEDVMLLLSTAQKYQMNPILCRIRASYASQDPSFIRPETSFQVYSLAQRYGLRQEALQAARSTLTFPFTIENLEDELDPVPGNYLHELWKYYQSVRSHLASDLPVFRETGIPSAMAIQPCYSRLTWLYDYIASIAESPALFNLTEFHMCLSRHAKNSQCICTNIPRGTIHVFWMALSSVVHSCMTKAESDILLFGGPEAGASPSCPRNASPLPDHLDMSDADIIIQSCDLLNFRVHKSTLAMSSPFFNDVLSLPQPPGDEVVDGLPVMRVPEDAEVLNGLLTMLYPVPAMIPDSYDEALTLLVASHKYDMAGIESHIRAEIKCRNFSTPTGPAAFRAFAILSRVGLPSDMETAARLTLDFPMTFEYLCDELPSFEGWALRELVGYRKRCQDNLVSCFQSFLKLSKPPFDIWTSCSDSARPNSTPTNGYSPSWLTSLFQGCLADVREGFTKPLLSPLNIREKYLSALQSHIPSYHSPGSYGSSGPYGCLSCSNVHALKGEAFCKELENRLELALSTVRLSASSGESQNDSEP